MYHPQIVCKWCDWTGDELALQPRSKAPNGWFARFIRWMCERRTCCPSCGSERVGYDFGEERP